MCALLAGQCQNGVHLIAGRAVGVLEVGTGFQDTETHLLDHLSGLFTQQVHGFIQHGVFMGVQNHISDGGFVAVLPAWRRCGTTRRVFRRVGLFHAWVG